MSGDDSATQLCIYCLRRLDARKFNVEHVLSEAFGEFVAPLKLYYRVCRECNQFFGDQLEVRFARGAFEGMLRYQKRLKIPPAGTVRLPFVEFAIPDGSEWTGVRLTLTNGDDGLHLRVIPQAAFFDKNQERWAYLTVDEIDAGLLTRRPDLKKGQIRIFAPSPQEHDAIVSKLNEHGITFEKSGDLQAPESAFGASDLLVEVTFTINKGIRRCIAKYAFNYLAFVCGSEFAAGSDFDTIRQFVRFGTVPSYPLVVTSLTPILHGDQQSLRQTDGHLLTVSWDGSLFDLVGEVSLFNQLTHRVFLCRQFAHALWRPIRSGHHYDLSTRRITRLVGLPADLTR